jgi:NAD(P)-dependent dehydrogenase (short-subunit alcohol dehydrogenase family)
MMVQSAAETVTTSSSKNQFAGRLRHKVTIVTGAAGGIGAAIARRFAAEGARLVLADRDQERAKAVAASLPSRAQTEALVQAFDVSDEKAVGSCVDAVLKRFGRLDGIVNNAGSMAFKPMIDWTRGDWEKTLGIDLLGAAFFSSQALRHMSEGGAIVNIASIHALRTTPEVAPYAAAKAALLSLTRSTAIEGKARGIRANAILPGAIDTPMLWENPNVKAGIEKIDPSDVGSAEDVANAALYLISDEARFVSGASLVVDGGRTIRL